MPIRRSPLIAACLLVSGMMSGAAMAQTAPLPRGVLELFTSQGCSSCPPADALFVKLANEPGLIVLSFPVGIWDYLGWRDTLAQPAFTHRQKQYGYARGDRQVYTPQAIVNGAAHAVGSDFLAIDHARRSTAEAGALTLPVSMELANDTWRARIPASAGRGIVWLVPFDRLRSVQISRGENTGKSISYANVARGLVKLADYNGDALSLDLPADARSDKEAGFAILVQSGSEKRPGSIIGAAEAPRP